MRESTSPKSPAKSPKPPPKSSKSLDHQRVHHTRWWGVAPDANNPPRQPTICRLPWEGSEPTSPEPPASSLASSDGGARGCGVELGVGGAFPSSASDVRSTRVDRERLAEARAQVCERGQGERGDARGERVRTDLAPGRRK